MLSLKTFNSLFDMLRAFPDEGSCVLHLERLRWNGVVVSPFVSGSSIYVCSNHRYKCRLSNRYFTVRSGTMFEGSKVSLQKWFYAIYVVSSHKKGISSHQLARDIEVTQKTAWFMLQRIRKAMGHSFYKILLSGVVEADETFVGGKNKNRHRDKKVEKCQGRSFKDKTPVFGLLQRGGQLYAKVIKNTSGRSIKPLIHDHVQHRSVLMSDEWLAYRGLGGFYDHRVIDHGKQQYVDGANYTNTLEGAWSWLKRMIIGIYHRVSRGYLQFYVHEFVFKYNTRKFRDGYRFNELLNRCFFRRLSHKELTNAA